jgi:hypothetical protein
MIAYTDDGVLVCGVTSSIPPEQLDAAISRDRNLTLRYAERLLADSEQEKPATCLPDRSGPVRVGRGTRRRGKGSLISFGVQ